MDGVHDLGGMDGMGPIVRDPDEPTFHAEWERRVFGMQFSTEGGPYNVDEFRHAIERMDPAYYLGSSYYEHWLAGIEKLYVEAGVLDAAELRDRLARLGTAETFDEGLPERHDPEATAELTAAIREGATARRERVEPAFEPGDEVVVRNEHPEGHTRCPRYVRRARGRVESVHGTFVTPDTNAHGEGEQPEPVYHVAFDTAELWDGDAGANETVCIDLWERYLRPTEESAATAGGPDE
jgi:nitrile hydratase